MRLAWLCVPAVLGGCSSFLGIEDLAGPIPRDAAIDAVIDAPPGMQIPATIVVRGAVFLAATGETVVSTLVGLQAPDGSPVRASTSDAMGLFGLGVETSGAPVDVAVAVTGDPTIDSRNHYVYFPAPLTADRDNVAVLLRSGEELKRLASDVLVTYSDDLAFVIVTVRDANGDGVAGERVAVDDPTAAVLYPNTGGADVTGVGGVAYIFASPGSGMRPATVSATGAIAARPRLLQLVAGSLFEVELRQ
jgi:hypothetical protein